MAAKQEPTVDELNADAAAAAAAAVAKRAKDRGASPGMKPVTTSSTGKA